MLSIIKKKYQTLSRYLRNASMNIKRDFSWLFFFFFCTSTCITTVYLNKHKKYVYLKVLTMSLIWINSYIVLSSHVNIWKCKKGIKEANCFVWKVSFNRTKDRVVIIRLHMMHPSALYKDTCIAREYFKNSLKDYI